MFQVHCGDDTTVTLFCRYQINMQTRLIPESELKVIVTATVKQVLADLLGLDQQQHQRQWYKTSDAAHLLDLDTVENLHDLRLAGDLKEGKHWRQSSSTNARRPTYQYHVGNCRQLLESRRS